MKFLLLILLFTSTAFAAFIPWSPTAPVDAITTKGGLLTSNGTIQTVFPACADGEGIEFDILEANGFKCVTAGGGGGTTDNGTEVVMLRDTLQFLNGEHFRIDAATNVLIGNSTSMAGITTGVSNIVIGDSSAGRDLSSANNSILLGNFAGRAITTGSSNIIMGSLAGYNIISGRNNIGIGDNSLANNATGHENTCVGFNSCASSTGGALTRNTALGYRAGFVMTTASNNVLLGERAGDSLSTGSDNILIGKLSDTAAATDSSKLNIGDTIYGDLLTDFVGIGVVAPTTALDVSGTVTATAFAGDGSALTGTGAPTGFLANTGFEGNSTGWTVTGGCTESFVQQVPNNGDQVKYVCAGSEPNISQTVSGFSALTGIDYKAQCLIRNDSAGALNFNTQVDGVGDQTLGVPVLVGEYAMYTINGVVGNTSVGIEITAGLVTGDFYIDNCDISFNKNQESILIEGPLINVANQTGFIQSSFAAPFTYTGKKGIRIWMQSAHGATGFLQTRLTVSALGALTEKLRIIVDDGPTTVGEVNLEKTTTFGGEAYPFTQTTKHSCGVLDLYIAHADVNAGSLTYSVGILDANNTLDWTAQQCKVYMEQL